MPAAIRGWRFIFQSIVFRNIASNNFIGLKKIAPYTFLFCFQSGFLWKNRAVLSVGQVKPCAFRRALWKDTEHCVLRLHSDTMVLALWWIIQMKVAGGLQIIGTDFVSIPCNERQQSVMGLFQLCALLRTGLRWWRILMKFPEYKK